MRFKIELTLVILFLIAGIFLLSLNPSITGFVAKDFYSTEIPGTYSFYPSMKSSINYDFSDYEKIKQKIDVLTTNCADKLGNELVECIKNNLVKINDENFDFYFKYNGKIIPEEKEEDWHNYCEKANESFFYDFVEFVDSCQNSDEIDCYCEMPIYDSNLEFEFDVSKNENKLNFKYNDKIEEREIKKQISIPQKIIFDGDIGRNDEVKIGDIEYENNIYLNNKIDGLSFIKKEDAEKIGRCKSGNRYIKACVISKNNKVIAKNPIKKNEEAKFQNIITRFAFYLKDLPPPPVKNVYASDNIKATESVLLKWSESEATDVVSYNIYYYENDFKGKKTSEISFKKSVKVDNAINVHSLDISNININCQKVGNEKRCQYSYSTKEGEIELKKEMLYYDLDSKSYIYILPIDNDKEFYFGISAVDRAGQESEEIIETANAKSIDDLAAGEIRDIQVVDNKAKWSRPLKNIDGSDLDSAVVLTYDVYAGLLEYGICKDIKLISSGSQLTSLIVNPDNCDFKVIAIKTGGYPSKDSEEYRFLLT